MVYDNLLDRQSDQPFFQKVISLHTQSSVTNLPKKVKLVGKQNNLIAKMIVVIVKIIIELKISFEVISLFFF